MKGEIFLKIIGIICEYNPLHNGHKKQMDAIRSHFGGDAAIVCLMSGNYVQRGKPALFDKSVRAEAAVLTGADLVLELPVTCALSSAEGFAAGGVRILGDFCDYLCFGAETPDPEALWNTAQVLVSEDFSVRLKTELATGKSFPAARQAALAQFHSHAELLSTPNNILAVEYCKAMYSQGTKMRPFPIFREGCYHDPLPQSENPSATAVRKLMLASESWHACVPREVAALFENAPMHTLIAGERGILARLRTMEDQEFESLPFGSEGLWRKLMHASRQYATVEEIASAVKSKRYTRSRIDRMILCAFLGLTDADLRTPAPYTRVLALNDRGRAILKEARKYKTILNPGQSSPDSYFRLDTRAGDLYGLFAGNAPESPGIEKTRRILYRPNSTDL